VDKKGIGFKRCKMSETFKVITLGCKVNQYESAYLEESLVSKGCRKVGADGSADLVIINTCIVTARASYQSRQAIRRAIRENPGAIITVTGCYGQAYPDELIGIKGVDVISGNRGKDSLPEIVAHGIHHDPPLVLKEDFGHGYPFEHTKIKEFSGRTRAFLKVQDGCDCFCSYCIVPKARGPIRSLEPKKVMRDLDDLEQSGYREVVLTGVNLGKYGLDLGNGINLTRLLTEMNSKKRALRIRLSSLEPTEIDPALIELMAKSDLFCRHFHISLQSGDDSVLRRMNRHYTAEAFTSVVKDMVERIPRVSIGIDVLVGFPGETQSAFHNTFSLLEELPVTYMHVFPFSKREGTAAARFPEQIDHKMVKERAFLLRRLDKQKRNAFWFRQIGESFQVLTEGWDPREKNVIRGLSDNYVRFRFSSTKKSTNEMVKIKATEVTQKGINGLPIAE
jgi:threonylcarbamoyladenosine tRNA methylthiotransferase MtaB